MLYTYKKNGIKPAYVIYFWLGNMATPDARGAAALLSLELDESLAGVPVEVRVTQGKEPAHFRSIFCGTTIIHLQVI